MKYSFRSLIPLLPLFCNCKFRRLDSVQFLCFQAHTPADWRLETQLTLLNWTFLYNHFARTTEKTHPLYCREGVFSAPLHSNGSYSIVDCVFVASEMCLPSRCLAMSIYSDFAISASGRNVTIRYTRSDDLAWLKHVELSITCKQRKNINYIYT
jgi:hypothetical protein